MAGCLTLQCERDGNAELSNRTGSLLILMLFSNRIFKKTLLKALSAVIRRTIHGG